MLRKQEELERKTPRDDREKQENDRKRRDLQVSMKTEKVFHNSKSCNFAEPRESTKI